jgi:hypothetical protein
MTSDTDKQPERVERSPFSQSIARRILEELFGSQPQWKSNDLKERVIQLHRERGGFTPSEPVYMINRALQELKRAGLVSAPANGYLRWTGTSQGGPANLQEPMEHTTNSVEAGIEEVDDIEPIIRPEKEIGDGNECVYLYFNPNDRELAELKGRDVWECKIGRTSNRNAIPRIFSQGIRTALSRVPTVGLVLRTDDSLALETALHSSLRLVGAEVPDAPGNEWFTTSPVRVEAWCASFQTALAAIATHKTNSTNPGASGTVSESPDK